MGLRRIGAAAFAALLITSLAACGDDDGGDDESGTSLEDVDGESSDDSSDDSSDEEASDVDDAIAGAFSEGCAEFGSVFGALGGAAAAFDPEAAEEFENFLDDAPDEIRDDLETIAAAYEEFADAFEDAGFDPEDPDSFDPSNLDAVEVITEAQEAFTTSEFEEATTNVSDFVANGCET